MSGGEDSDSLFQISYEGQESRQTSRTELVRKAVVVLEDFDEVIEHPKIHRDLRVDFFDQVHLVLNRDVKAEYLGVRERAVIAMRDARQSATGQCTLRSHVSSWQSS
jgi:hypothetical protein